MNEPEMNIDPFDPTFDINEPTFDIDEIEPTLNVIESEIDSIEPNTDIDNSIIHNANQDSDDSYSNS